MNFIRFTLAAAILAAAAMLPQAATAGVRYVVSGAMGTGASWGDASGDLQEMINLSGTGDEVWVAAGTYKPHRTAAGWNSSTNNYPTGDGGRFNAFVLKEGVRIYGGFTPGVTGSVPVFGTAGRDGESRLSGDLDDTNDWSSDDAYHVVIGVNIPDNNPAVLDGFTVSGGNADVFSVITVNGQTVVQSVGGGIFNTSSLQLTDVTISGNRAADYGSGGGIFNQSSLQLTRVTISRNEASYAGGGIYNTTSSSLQLTDVTISENTATGNGGGIYNESSYSSLVLTDVTISKNSATSGGGIFNNSSSSSVLIDVTISENSATIGGGIYNVSSLQLTDVTIHKNKASTGGGICNTNSSSQLQLTRVIISENEVTSVGGGIYNISSSPVLTDVTIHGNEATDIGGGIYNGNSSPQLTRVTISKNKAYSGGGICNFSSSSPQLSHVTISENTATNTGGGIYNDYSSSPVLTDVTISDNQATNTGGGISNYNSSSLQLTDVTVSGNQAPSGGGIYNYSSSASLLINVLISGNTATGNGGGIYNTNSSPVLTNVTIRGNTATGNGGGIFNASSSSPQLTNTIIWENSSSIYNSSGSPAYEYSLVEGEPLTGTNLDGTDPANNPQFISPVDSRLKATSPAIDRGDNAAYLTARGLPGPPLPDFTGETDLAAQPRLWDGVIDMGAYEFSFTIVLDPASPYAMPAATYGCGDCSPLTVTVTNTGSRPTGTLTVALGGLDPGAFALSSAAVGSIPVGGIGSFVLVPAAGLPAGSYDATVTVSGDNGISASLSVSFTLNKAEPTVDELDFDLRDAVYAGMPLPVAVAPGAGISGLGAITVLYDGQTRLPDGPGTYTVTVDIVEGANYLAVEGLLLGTFTVYEYPRPDIPRVVTLPSAAGLTTDPPAGRHYVASGTDFTFTLTPAAPSANGAPPAVRTNRTVMPDASGLRITPNGDGSYTVVIRAVRQDIGVAFSDPGAGTDVAEGGGIWSSGNRVYVSSPRGGRATVYSLMGAVVKAFDAAAGVTASETLPAGIWIVVFDGQRRKAVVGE